LFSVVGNFKAVTVFCHLLTGHVISRMRRQVTPNLIAVIFTAINSLSLNYPVSISVNVRHCCLLLRQCYRCGRGFMRA